MKTSALPGLCKELLAKPNRAKLAVALGAAAMVLILLSELLPAPGAPAVSTPETVSTAAPYKQQLEQQLEHLIGQVDGAGETTVMLTLESGEETIYALDTLSGQTQSQQTHVLLEDGTALAAKAPYDRLYGLYVQAQIHYADGDMVRCSNALSLWNEGVAEMQAAALREKGGAQAAKCLRFC